MGYYGHVDGKLVRLNTADVEAKRKAEYEAGSNKDLSAINALQNKINNTPIPISMSELEQLNSWRYRSYIDSLESQLLLATEQFEKTWNSSVYA